MFDSIIWQDDDGREMELHEYDTLSINDGHEQDVGRMRGFTCYSA